MKELDQGYKGHSLSHATMRAEDLVPAFYDFLNDCIWGKEMQNELEKLIYHELSNVSVEIQEFINWDLYYDTDYEYANHDLEELFGLLNRVAPAGCYFGSHPGDGSDYGFWECEDV